MGRLVNVKGDFGLHKATFIAKLPRSLPSGEEWLTESCTLYRSENGKFLMSRLGRRNVAKGNTASVMGVISDHSVFASFCRETREWQFISGEL